MKKRKYSPKLVDSKIRKDDLGPVDIRFAVQDNNLLLIFPYPTDWIGLDRKTLDGLIKMLQGYAEKLTYEPDPFEGIDRVVSEGGFKGE